MADTFTANLRLRKPEVGANDDAWAELLNEMLTVVETSIAGAVSVSVTSGDATLTVANGSDDQARRMFVYVTGSQSVTTRVVVVPDTPKLYVFINDSAQQVTFERDSGGTTVVVRAGQTVLAAVTSAGIFQVPLGGSFVEDDPAVSQLTLDINGTHGAGDATCEMEYIVQGSWVFVNIESFDAQNFSSTAFSLDRTGGVNWPTEIMPDNLSQPSVPILVIENGTLVPARMRLSSNPAAAWAITKVDANPWLGTGTDDRSVVQGISFAYTLREPSV